MNSFDIWKARINTEIVFRCRDGYVHAGTLRDFFTPEEAHTHHGRAFIENHVIILTHHGDVSVSAGPEFIIALDDILE